jgi:prefoldin subunit 5
MFKTKKKVPVVVDPIVQLQTESEDAISIFSRTIEKLSNANESAAAEKAKKEEELKAVQTQIATIDAITSKNENFINKINTLFTED